MKIAKILIGLILMIFLLFIFFELIGNKLVALHLKSIISPVIAITYFIITKKRALFYALFLILYAMGDMVYLVVYYFNFSDMFRYLSGNILYISSYGCILLLIFKSISWKHVFKNFKLHFVILMMLNLYIIYVLNIITIPNFENSSAYILEIVYNLVILSLLSLSLLNYFYRDNIKSLYIFIGSLCIVFSEVITLAYWYITSLELLSILSALLMLLAFYFFYKQSNLHEIQETDIIEV